MIVLIKLIAALLLLLFQLARWRETVVFREINKFYRLSSSNLTEMEDCLKLVKKRLVSTLFECDHMALSC